MNTLLFNESRPIQFQDVLPSKVDVVVMAGGVAGVCTGYYLAQAGPSVLVSSQHVGMPLCPS